MKLKQFVPLRLRSWLARLLFSNTPVLWANWGPFSRALATTFSPRQPPVVVVSMPRSGSSWVGEVMGMSPGALYLREPFSQALLAAGQSSHVVREVDPQHLPETYRESADSISIALPLFGPNIVRERRQWRLLDRRRKRVVVKDVNPLMSTWLRAEVAPRVIYLVRHPASVADSYHRLGWTDTPIGVRFGEATLSSYSSVDHAGDSFWARHGATQAVVLRETMSQLHGDPNVRVVRYEDLCREPVKVFKELYEFAELPWSDTVERGIVERSNPQAVDSGDFGVLRDSTYEMEKWRHRLTEEQVRQIRDAWLSFDPPFYGDDEW